MIYAFYMVFVFYKIDLKLNTSLINLCLFIRIYDYTVLRVCDFTPLANKCFFHVSYHLLR